MAKARIAIVEDEALVAADLRQRLLGFGYDVAGVASTGTEALELARRIHPDLMLLDIKLPGSPDGIGVGESLRREEFTPIIYLTAYSGDEMVERARKTHPYGFIVKPFNERQLFATIEIALDKSKAEKRLRDGFRWISETLSAETDGVIAVNTEGRVMFINEALRALGGWNQDEICGMKLPEILRFDASGLSGPFADTSMEADLKDCDGQTHPVTVQTIPLMNRDGESLGHALIIRKLSGAGERNVQDQEGSTLRKSGLQVLSMCGDPIIRQGVRQVFSTTRGIAFTGEMKTFNELLKIRDVDNWDVVVLDRTMMIKLGSESIEKLKRTHPDLQILLLCTDTEDAYVVDALRQGISCYAIMEGETRDIGQAVRQVASGRQYVSPLLSEGLARRLKVFSRKPSQISLSKRETEVLRGIVSGKTLKEISSNVALSVKTVSTYRTRILKKLGLKTTSDLIKYGLESRIIP